ncbi:3D domain protein [Planoprotostelium fungivorum]|uniref:3D domain protein n=1 Tax=Planoprotostelium fungivorum TaxID=1890364 RepID=A0A2P6NKB1_9EUKA|nr:3D domain protein [Planoprotostelium fungivorum]
MAKGQRSKIKKFHRTQRRNLLEPLLVERAKQFNEGLVSRISNEGGKGMKVESLIPPKEEVTIEVTYDQEPAVMDLSTDDVKEEAPKLSTQEPKKKKKTTKTKVIEIEEEEEEVVMEVLKPKKTIEKKKPVARKLGKKNRA